MPLVLLDLEEFETLMGVVAEGESLVRVLERKTSLGWVERDFKSWHKDDPVRIGTGESTFVAQDSAARSAQSSARSPFPAATSGPTSGARRRSCPGAPHHAGRK